MSRSLRNNKVTFIILTISIGMLLIIVTVVWIYQPSTTRNQLMMISNDMNTRNTFQAINYHPLNFGIILFAYSNTQRMCRRYLHEMNMLCNNLFAKNSRFNKFYHLNITLFTIESHYKDYLFQNSFSNCILDSIIFVDKLNTSSLNGKREFSTRIQLFLHSPYYITMSLDTDIYPCYPLNIIRLYDQMIDKDIDFAYTSFRRHNTPQGGLFLYKNNNKSKYLINSWWNYHTKWKLYDDQKSLHSMIKRIDINININVNIYLLNNRYNYRGFGLTARQKKRQHNQLLYPNNKILMFHRRKWLFKQPENVCKILNKYTDNLTMAYDDGENVRNCFKDKDPKCIDQIHMTNISKYDGVYKNQYKFFWSEDYHCQWNESVDFVPIHEDTCM